MSRIKNRASESFKHVRELSCPCISTICSFEKQCQREVHQFNLLSTGSNISSTLKFMISCTDFGGLSFFHFCQLGGGRRRWLRTICVGCGVSGGMYKGS